MSRQRRKVAGAFRHTGRGQGQLMRRVFESYINAVHILAAKRFHKEYRREIVIREQEFHSDSALY